MDEHEIKELSRMESADDCCPFCVSRCIKCGSVDIEVEYFRCYRLNGKVMTFESSGTSVGCFGCATNEFNIEKENELRKGIAICESGFVGKLEYISNPGLAKQLDEFFADHETLTIPPKFRNKLSEKGLDCFVYMYKYENIQRNEISINCVDSFFTDEEGRSIYDDLANSLHGLMEMNEMNLTCKESQDEPGKHWVIESQQYQIGMASEAKK